MPLARFSLENYRCFDKPQEVELGRVTVVLGKNNSGKSALVRAPLVLSTGIDTRSSLPLDLDQLGEPAPTFRDLIYGGSPHGRVRLRLDLEDPHFESERRSLEATIQNIYEWQTQVISDMLLRYDSRMMRLTWLQDENDRDDERSYRVEMDGKSFPSLPLRFRGLLPWIHFSQQQESWNDIRNQFGLMSIYGSFDTIRYLGPFRERPERVYRLPSRPRNSVGENGEAALGILANDMVRRQGRLLDRLNEYLAENLPGWKLGVADRGWGMFSVELRSTSDSDLTVDLADAGTGVAQLLPILVQRAVDAVEPPKKPVLEIIEEPELHLHPSAHALVADLILNASQESSVRFLVETHSETFLLRLRRRIAEGRVDPKDVCVYFVEHDGKAAHARRIGIDRLGNLDYWPHGVFSEDFEETRALAVAQEERAEENAG